MENKSKTFFYIGLTVVFLLFAGVLGFVLLNAGESEIEIEDPEIVDNTPNSDTDDEKITETILELINQNDNYSEFVDALEKSSFNKTLESNVIQFTLLVPSNEVYTSAMNEYDTKNENEALSDLITNHAFEGKINIENFTDSAEITNLFGETFIVSISDSQEIEFFDSENNGIRILDEGTEASNGIFYEVDSLLIPQI